MYHYVYYSYEEWGRGYIGVRSCKCLPEEDVKYFGSYTDKTFAPTNKIILLTFETREEANAAEVALHAYYKVDENPHFANRAKQLTEHFVCRGERSAEVRGNMKRARQRWVEENKDKLSIIFAKSAEKIKKYRKENEDEINKNFVENVMELGRQYWKEHPEEASKRSKKSAKVLHQYWADHPEEYKAFCERRSLHLKQRVQEMGHPLAKKVKVIFPDGSEIIFSTIRQCSVQLGTSPAVIRKRVAGEEGKKFKGFTFLFLD